MYIDSVPITTWCLIYTCRVRLRHRSVQQHCHNILHIALRRISGTRDVELIGADLTIRHLIEVEHLPRKIFQFMSKMLTFLHLEYRLSQLRQNPEF